MTIFLNLSPVLIKYNSLSLLLANYTILTVASILIFSTLRWVVIKNIDNSSGEFIIVKIFVILFFLNLAGIPPLPGFFIKLNLLLFVINYINIYTTVIIVLFNFTIFYFYIQFYRNTTTYTKNKTHNLCSNVLPMIVTLIVFLNFIPLYHLLTLFIL